jgi:hypothetical protein
MRLFLAVILLMCFTSVKSQNMAAKFGLEITKFKVGVNAGPYRGRTQQTDGPFDQGIAGFGQIYFPFQVSYGVTKDTSTVKYGEYDNKIILLRPSTILHLVDNGSVAYGGGIQISFRTIKHFYLEYQFGIVYLEAKEGLSPDLNDGMNLHHFVSISKPLNRHFTASLGFIHMSKGWFNSKTSNQDVISLGIRYNL